MQATYEAQAALLQKALQIFGGSPLSDQEDLPLSPFDVAIDCHESHTEPSDVSRVASKKRKPTYYVRKEEKVRLAEEVEELERKIRELQAAQHVSAKHQLDQSIAWNVLLNSDIEDNNLALAGVQSMISAEMVSRFRNPLDHYIYMPADPELRRHSLTTLRSLKTETATRLIRERMKHLDIRESHRHSECTLLKNGDYLVTQFDVTPFEGHSDVRLVFEKFVEFIASQEVNISDKLDIVSVHLTEECVESSAKQSRMLSSVAPGLDIETNAAMFASFVESPDDAVPNFGMAIIDYVDKDDIYSYEPATRLRMDITGCVYVTETPPDVSTTTSSLDDGQTGTSMVRFATIRLHRSQFPISKVIERQARATADNWNSVMPRVLLESLGLYY